VANRHVLRQLRRPVSLLVAALGPDVLVSAGWSGVDIGRLVERAKAGDVPWT